MRIPSGVTDQYIYFVAVDATDFSTRETGLSSFTVFRSRNGAAAAAMTTPTINETDTTNMPGVYELLLDEDMTIAAGNDSEEMCFHITATGMAPVTRTIELYRPKITAGNTLDVTATGAAGIDWGNVENAGTTVDLSATSINLCDTITTYTGNTVQTGDSFARLGAPAGASVSADIAAIEAQTDDIGVAGAGLTAIPWNAAWDAEVESEVNDALVAVGLDHLVSAAVVGADVTDNSIIARMVSSSATADWDSYVNTTDSLQAIRDRGDTAWITGGGGGLTQSINPIIAVPPTIDLADTATVRVGIILTNTLDDLPSTAEITPGTVSIWRKAQGGTSWTSVVSAAAMSEQAGLVYYDEVFDSGTGYAAGDLIRIQFESVSVTADSNTYEITGASGVYVYSYIAEPMRGTDSAYTGTPPTAVENRQEMDSNSTQLEAIVADTNELQGDWVNGGRLDLILDARASQTSVNTVDTVVDGIKAVTDNLPDSGALTTIDTNIDAILVDTGTTLPGIIDDLAIKKNTAFPNFEFVMVLSSDDVTPATGKTVTGERSIDGGAFASVSGTISEVSNGLYKIDALAADTNGDVITWRFSNADCNDTFITFKTVQ